MCLYAYGFFAVAEFVQSSFAFVPILYFWQQFVMDAFEWRFCVIYQPMIYLIMSGTYELENCSRRMQLLKKMFVAVEEQNE